MSLRVVDQAQEERKHHIRLEVVQQTVLEECSHIPASSDLTSPCPETQTQFREGSQPKSCSSSCLCQHMDDGSCVG